jgi:GNAT superfamily N-acetyltransferase
MVDVGEVSFDHAPARLTKGMARHPVPLMLLARLAVHREWQGRGLGAGLLKDALRRTLQAADIAGIRALAVHAKDEKARAFYRHFDFVDSPTDPLHLFLLLKDLRRYVE